MLENTGPRGCRLEHLEIARTCLRRLWICGAFVCFETWTFITSQSAAHLLLWFSGEPPGFHLFVVGGIQNCHVKLSCTPQKGCHPTILHGLQLMPRDILHCQLSLSLKALENVEPENRDGQWTKTCWMLRMET